jgi:hypothetical protein
VLYGCRLYEKYQMLLWWCPCNFNFLADVKTGGLCCGDGTCCLTRWARVLSRMMRMQSIMGSLWDAHGTVVGAASAEVADAAAAVIAMFVRGLCAWLDAFYGCISSGCLQAKAAPAGNCGSAVFLLAELQT